MRRLRDFALWSSLAICCAIIAGCGTKEKGPAAVDENKPVSEVKAEADKMDNAGLRASALAYKDAMIARTKDVDKISQKLMGTLGADTGADEVKKLKTELDQVNKSISALEARFQVYYDRLKEKGGDLSGLSLQE